MTRLTRPQLRPPKMYAGLATRKSAHQLYMKMSTLEMEKARRREELRALTHRVDLLKNRIAELDDEVALTQAEIAELPESVTGARLEMASEIVRAQNAAGIAATPQPAAGDASQDAKTGFMIKY